ncbi:MAG: hypothetical protein HQK89_18215, partial [Nitrospirae bacterium]|nr:hypothetical protein [Nitrospirota bacterium]
MKKIMNRAFACLIFCIGITISITLFFNKLVTCEEGDGSGKSSVENIGKSSIEGGRDSIADRESPSKFENEIKWLQAEAVVTGASKYEQKISEAPSNVTIYTSGDIRKYGFRTIG